MRQNSRTQVFGHIGKAPEVKDFNSRTLISFSVAEDDSYIGKDGNKVERTIWHNCQLWVKQGKTGAIKVLEVGNFVYLEGKARATAWINKEGKAIPSLELIVDDFKILKYKNNGESKEASSGKSEHPF